MKLEGEREREVWNAAIRAAEAACRSVDRAAYGQGHRMGRARGGPIGVNPHAHRSGEISLGAQRCLGEIAGLRR